MELKDMLEERLQEIMHDKDDNKDDSIVEWNSMFAEKVDDKSEKDTDDSDSGDKESDESEEDASSKGDTQDTDESTEDETIEDDSIVNDLDSTEETSDDKPPEIDTDPEENPQDNMDELASKIHLSKNEVAILDDMIDSETDAISDYSRGLTEAKNKYVRKLLTEILTDESKHLAQLKYLKSLGTDDDYVPKDQEAIDELQDTLENVTIDLDDLW